MGNSGTTKAYCFLIALLFSLLGATHVRAQAAAAIYFDEDTFLSAINSPSLIDFEGIAEPDSPVFLGDPGNFFSDGVTINNNSQMFVQNVDTLYGSGSFLSPQGGDTQVVTILLPPDTVAVGFSYAHADSVSASAVLEGDAGATLPAPGSANLGFFGAYRETGIEYIVVAVNGAGIDLDNLWFKVEADPAPTGTYTDRAEFLSQLFSPANIDFEGIAEPGEDVYLGNPGAFSAEGVNISNNSQMFLRYIADDPYGTGAYLSPQGADPQVVQFALPTSTVAFGFSYSYRNYGVLTATVSIDGNEEYILQPEPAGALGFFGVVHDQPIEVVTVTVTGGIIDLDDVTLQVDPSVRPPRYLDETAFLTVVEFPTLIDFEGIIEPNESVVYGDPGAFVEAGVRIANDSVLYVQNTDLYNTSSILSAQQETPQNLLIQLPQGTLAVGFSYSSSAGTVTLNNNEVFELPAQELATLGFFGFVRDEPIETIQLSIDGDYIDLDNLWFVRAPGSIRTQNLPGGGSVDTSFGDNGVLLLEQLLQSEGIPDVFGLGVQPGGQIVIAGTRISDSQAEFVVARMDLTGTLDTTFGDNGISAVNVGPSGGFVSDMQVLTDGTMLVSGRSGNTAATSNSYVFKLDEDGDLEAEFGTAGITAENLDTTAGGPGDGYERIVVRENGSILLGTTGLGIHQLDVDGNRDLDFGAGGVAIPQNAAWSSYGLAEMADSTVVFGGGSAGFEGSQDFIVGRYLPDGSALDPTFGIGGVATTQLNPDNDALLDLAVDFKGRIVALGYTKRGDRRRTAVVRYLPDGQLDASFGYGGVRMLDGIGLRTIYATRILLRPDGGLLLSGQAGSSLPNPDQEIFVLSLHEDGSVDESFAGQGWAELDVWPTQENRSLWLLRDAMALHPSGKIVVLNWECACMTLLDAPDWNDSDGDGMSNHIDPDDDNDGVEDSEDAFPLNAAESVDTDGDGIGNNADADDDNDGLSDADETSIHSTDPLNKDTDGDGLNDGDEIQNGLDPLNPADCPESLCPTSSSMLLRLLPTILELEVRDAETRP